MTEELLRIEDKKKAVYSSYLSYSLVTESSVYTVYSKRLSRIEHMVLDETTKKEEKEVKTDSAKK